MLGSIFMRAIALLAVVALTVSCDAITGGKDGSFTLSLSDATLNLGQGKKDTVVITLARTSFTKPIALSVTGTPAGITATLLAPTVPGNSSVTGLELSATGTATLATSTLTIKALGAGVAEKTATVDVVVGVTGTFSLSSQGFPLTAAQGGGGIGTILIPRTGGHGDNVTLAATGLPSGVTASFGASPTSSTATAVSFTAAAGAAPGTYNVTISGDAAGLQQQQTPVTINVIAPPATAALSMPFCASSTPPWFAYQNQGYPWQVATPTNGVFTFQATSAVGVAYVVVINNTQTNETRLIVDYAARSELAAETDRDCAGPKSFTGSVAGATSGQTVRIAMGAALGSATAASPNFSLTGVYDRPLDLIASKGVISVTANNILRLAPDLLLMQRNLNPANGAALGTLDFSGQGFAPASTNLTVSNINTGDSLNIATTFWSSPNTYGTVHGFTSTTSANSVLSMPAAKFQAGDLQELVVESYQPFFQAGRLAVLYLGALADRTEALTPNVATATVSTISASPSTRMRAQLPVQAEYPAATRMIYFQGGGNAADRYVFLTMTAGYLGGTPASTWDVSIPEFGTVTGLNSSWLLSTSLLAYQTEAYAGPGPVLYGAVPSIGDIIRVAYRVASTGSLLRADFRRPNSLAPLSQRQYLRR